MTGAKKPPKHRALIDLYGKMGSQMDVWLRVHLLVQAHRNLEETPHPYRTAQDHPADERSTFNIHY